MSYSPFNPQQMSPDNPFNKQAQQQQNSRGPMPEGFNQAPPDRNTVQSQAVPGYKVEGNAATTNQIQGAVERKGASPLDKYAEAVQYAHDEDTRTPSQAAEPGSEAAAAGADQDLFDLLKYQDVHGQFRKQDLAASVTPELLDKVLKEGDSKAFMQVLNEVAQNAAAAATFGSVQISKQGFGQRMDKFSKTIPDSIRKTKIDEMWQGNKDDLLNSPKVAPLRDAAVQMFAQTYPKATPEQLRGMVESYFEDMYGEGFSRKQVTQRAESPGTNFQKLFDDM